MACPMMSPDDIEIISGHSMREARDPMRPATSGSNRPRLCKTDAQQDKA